jgi:hypothetical protein
MDQIVSLFARAARTGNRRYRRARGRKGIENSRGGIMTSIAPRIGLVRCRLKKE